MVLCFMPPDSQSEEKSDGSTRQNNPMSILELPARCSLRPAKDVSVVLSVWKVGLHRVRFRSLSGPHRRHIDRHQARVPADEMMLQRQIDDRSANGFFVRSHLSVVHQRLDFGARPKDRDRPSRGRPADRKPDRFPRRLPEPATENPVLGSVSAFIVSPPARRGRDRESARETFRRARPMEDRSRYRSERAVRLSGTAPPSYPAPRSCCRCT